MKPRTALAAMFLAAGLATAAALSPAPRSAAQPAAAETPGAFQIDGVHSSVVFRIKHNNVSYFYGLFSDISGTFVLDPENPGNSAIDATVNADSVTSANEKRDGHLKSADFFNVAEFPTVTFKSNSVRKTGENTFEATGDLTLHGVTKPLTVTIEKVGEAQGRRGGTLAGFETKFTVKRSDFGMTYGIDGNALSDEVNMIVSVEGVRR
jgi:polyisoprenoid-binding protein YceI